MTKRYFGSPALQNTVRKVKEAFPECKVSFKEDENRTVSFRFTSDDRKKYSLSEGFRTYPFINGHLILGNGKMDPFKYDKLDDLIENTELEYDIRQRKNSIDKIRAAIDSCQHFHDTAEVVIGNVKSDGSMDIKLTLNDIPRCYHFSNKEEDVHLEKIDPDTKFEDAKLYDLKDINPNIQFKILKTTHPGLLTVATEYISGLKKGKENWNSVLDAYSKPWKKEIYDAMGISTFDVLADVPENRLVGQFADNPMRRLVVSDGSEYAYREDPLEITSYEDYRKIRDSILNKYKADVMKVCKTTGVITQTAIDVMNVYEGKPGPVVLCSPEEAINKIRIERLSDPLTGIIQKINRAIKLHNYESGFLASSRKGNPDCSVKRIDLNENGYVIKVDVDMNTLEVSEPYTTTAGYRRTYTQDLTRFPISQSFILTLKEELKKVENQPEYKLYKFSEAIKEYGFVKGKITEDNNQVLQLYSFRNPDYFLWVAPYDKEIGVNNIEAIRKDANLNADLELACDKFDEIFAE